MDSIKDKLKTIPNSPGVYQYYDKNETILYIGKAKNLKKRVSSYFNRNLENGKTKILVRKIVDIKYIVVETETDALLLESNLIKKYQPKYNILLKDDKSYPWICIKKERFPRVITTRKVIKDGSEYFGPYTNVKIMYTLLDLLKNLYPLRTCNFDLSKQNIAQKKYKVCLEYHIGNCLAPCVGKETEANYARYIDEIRNILKGNIKSVLKELEKLMHDFAAELKFEEAADIKEKIALLSKYHAKSIVVSPTIHNVDVITMINDEKSAFVNYFKVVNGAIIQGFTLEIKKRLDEQASEILPLALMDMRARYGDESNEILTSEKFNFPFKDVKLSVPQRGDKKTLVELSLRNAKYFKLEKLKQEKLKNPEVHTERILNTIQKDLHLKELPTHIECFDNSNFQGTNAVAACVVFKNAKPSAKDYRHFNIKTVEGPDDFASMTEVVYRRYKRMVDENQPLPQLIVIDGGKGQLSAAVKSLDDLNLRGQIAIIGIAKRLEEIFFPGDSIPIYLDKRSESLRVIQHLRNEAHRFGITHHRNKRSKNAIQSELTEIPGIGEKTTIDLIRFFKSVKRVKAASEKELVEAVGYSKAKLVYNFFQGEEE
ncbi:excinuclease ABC subunit C [Putridiphycobacter roseus]|uniref:UvrABC system protein C n=1 Tax=Putridiphycobacter roseus TaxID=2219161 RepID=A0A2W1NP41_9FLAO|nr:excinuclease ABC subunit UvrC [Putridiphycobacter roseus]PZE16378.1 excinuclease ABC subunit C [Putridiphycobacter roseus]